mmetsp:Transcript_14124/g.53077  ORF Transcript_14124/g.53077 Transcript_14124/m.53077 type:complete len:443 (-) Transcript_14124:107-1435(-)
MADARAAAYLRFLPAIYGDELDVSFSLQLGVGEGSNFTALPVSTSGGMQCDGSTWKSAMTFCDAKEAVESCGRARDWGAHVWSAADVQAALEDDSLRARVELQIWGFREDETSFPIGRGAFGAVFNSLKRYAGGQPAYLRAGEVVVPVTREDSAVEARLLEKGILPGSDLRIMGMRHPDSGEEIFSTELLEPERRGDVDLLLRPTSSVAIKEKVEYPLRVKGKDVPFLLSRFALGAFVPRFLALAATDVLAVLLATALATAPLPLALAGRQLLSFYVIPTTSMAPTLAKGDILLVDKSPLRHVPSKGDIVLFKPPEKLESLLPASAKGGVQYRGDLFVKRVVATAGDKGIRVNENGDVFEGDAPLPGRRDLCEDEPLGLIRKMLQANAAGTVDEVDEKSVYVLGDCAKVSVDSRVWGLLPVEDIVGRPVARIWPLTRAGLVK